MTELSIVAPAYNEEACIEASVQSWAELLANAEIDGEIVVANDGSTDQTGAILDRLAAELPVRVVHLAENVGYSRTVMAAITAARGEWVVTIDSDGQFAATDIPRLVACRERLRCDLVNGRRRGKKDSLLRIGADRGLARLVRTLFGLSVGDPNCALKLMRRSWIQKKQLRAQSFALPTEIVVRAAHDGLSICEVDIDHHERLMGETKLQVGSASFNMMRFLLALRWELWRGASS